MTHTRARARHPAMHARRVQYLSNKRKEEKKRCKRRYLACPDSNSFTRDHRDVKRLSILAEGNCRANLLHGPRDQVPKHVVGCVPHPQGGGTVSRAQADGAPNLKVQIGQPGHHIPCSTSRLTMTYRYSHQAVPTMPLGHQGPPTYPL